MGLGEAAGECAKSFSLAAAGGSLLEGQVVSGPPITNRGSVAPVTLISESETRFHPDYWKLTIFADSAHVKSVLEETILEAFGVLEAWSVRGPVQHWAEVWYQPEDLIRVLVPKTAREPYCMVEIKGQGVERFGMDGLRAFHRAIASWAWRWNGKRVDLAWDGSAISPELVNGWNRLGAFRSRTLNASQCHWEVDGLGFATAYLGMRLHHKPGSLRVYNKHGFNRVEVELVDALANDAMRALLDGADDQLPLIGLGYLLRTVDYVDPESSTRIERCKRLAEWSAFVGEAEKVKTLAWCPKEGPADERILPIGRSEMWFQRNARSLLRIIKALGVEYVERRAEYYGARNWGPEDEAAVLELKRYRYSGLAGTKFLDDDTPF